MDTDFSIIETMLWEDKDFFLLDSHLERMGLAAEHFSFPFDPERSRKDLLHISHRFDKVRRYLVRALLDKNGEFTVTDKEVDDVSHVPEKVVLSANRTRSDDEFLRYKTTNRSLYDREFEHYRSGGFFDVLFLNEKDEVTEGAITNVVIREGDRYYTPPVSSGLLPGTYRKFLFEKGPWPLEEKVLFKEDLLEADDIFVVNSVRKTVPAVLTIL